MTALLTKHEQSVPQLDDDDDMMSQGSSNQSTGPPGSSARDRTSSGVGEDHDASTEDKLARKETQAVFRLRLVVFMVLLMAAIAVSIIVYFVAADSEQEEYQAQFDGASKLVEQTFVGIVESRLSAVSSLGVAIIAHGRDHETQKWPFVTLSSFQQRAATARKQSDALYVHINPEVKNTERDAWENFTVNHPDAAWIERGFEYQNKVGLSFIQDVQPPRYHHDPNTAPWPIWYYDQNDEVTTDPTDGPFFPTWQSSPVMYNGSESNENILANKDGFNSGANITFTSNSVAISQLIMAPPGDMYSNTPSTALIALMMSIKEDGRATSYQGDPVSKVYFPIYNSFDDDRHAVAILLAWIRWADYFKGILPTTLKGIILVIQDSCGGQYTYEIYGENVLPRGRGDLHDADFNDMKRSVDFKHVANIADGTELGLPLNQDFCPISLDIYPSKTFHNIFKTNTPAIMTVAVALVFVFTAFMFVVYDRLVERRQALVMKRAMDTNAVVASLFPKNVRERLIEANSQQANNTTNGRGNAFIRQNDNGLKRPSNGVRQDVSSAPIADLFPHCTVMFADISGFTAWSSTREPAQVFILLQTVYQAFDVIAKRRKVFKVETIGDSYVAVTGLPEPMENHATCMARFSYDCLKRMNEITKELEIALGPDTASLSMRFGLNSGPVTAGVLQGERARFQLFGDTVNTAARMESTGMRGKIQVSKSTAELIEASGKPQWLKQRKDLVAAKGKGTMQTFWVNPSSSKPSSGSATGSGSQAGSTQESTLDASKTISPTSSSDARPVNHRLVSWMVELLMDDIKKVVHRRRQCGVADNNFDLKYYRPQGKTLLDEVQTKIKMPEFNAAAAEKAGDHKGEEISPSAVDELRQYVAEIASMYHNNPFHNFEHACHVTMSVMKLLKRIVTPDTISQDGMKNNTNAKVELANRLHDYTHGINSDPLTSLAITFSALIHDVDHRGVSNMQLSKEDNAMAEKYNFKSVAEQNSLDLAWDILQQDDYQNLRSCLFSSYSEMMRFRQVIINVVLATDIFDKELNDLRKSRWTQAFSGGETCKDSDLRATIVIEHIIQASDVSHTMQHWHVYQKWNKCLFRELQQAYRQERMAKDPSSFWFQGELGFFDNYVIPLAKKLKECGVFGVSSDEYLNYALQNRAEWAERGEDIVASWVEELRLEEEKSIARKESKSEQEQDTSL